MKDRAFAFFRNLRSPEKGSILNRERSILLLILTFIIVSIYAHSFEHGVDEETPHLKDEEGYYGWAELYTEGYYSIPLHEANGHYHYDSVFSTEYAENDIELEYEFGDLDGTGKENDILVTVSEKGAPVPDANVSVVVGSGGDRQASGNTTDGNGACVLFDLPFGKIPLEVEIPREDIGTPIIVREMIDSRAKSGLYSIYAEIDVERITDNLLGDVVLVESVKDGTPSPLTGVRVNLDGEELGVTNAKGQVAIPGGGKEHALIGIRLQSGDYTGIRISLGNESGEPDRKGNFFFSAMNEYRIRVTVRDIFGEPMEGVDIRIDPGDNNREPLGNTGKNGVIERTITISAGEHRVVAERTVDGFEPPLASGVASVDGEYHYVNHWPPGPSVLISWLMYVGLEGMFGTLVMLLLCFGTWGVASRIFGWRTAAVATFMATTCGITLQLYFGQWMGDLSSTAFAIGGLWLFLVALDMWKTRKGDVTGEIAGENGDENDPNGRTDVTWEDRGNEGESPPPDDRGESAFRRRFAGWPAIIGMAVLSGVLFGAGVTQRYSTIVACVMPYIFFLGMLVKDSVNNRGEGNGTGGRVVTAVKGRMAGFLRRLFSKENMLRALALLLPLTLGMAAVGLILMNYNSTYFGGPLNSGYQAQNIMAVTVTDRAENQSLADYEPPNSFFEGYFIWGEDDRENAPHIFQYVAIFVPFCFAALPALWFRKKEPMTYALFAWIVLTMIIYLSQGWVLKRTIEDIRYYAPLIPPAAILSASLLGSLWKKKGGTRHGIRGAGSRARWLVPVIIVLMLVGTVTAGDYAVHERMGRGMQGPPGQKDGGQGETDELAIPLLLENPDKYLEKRVTVAHIVIGKVLNEAEGAYLIADDKDPDMKMVMKCPETHPDLREDASLTATGIFRPDQKKPGDWMLWVKDNGDVTVLVGARGNGDKIDADDTRSGLETIPRSVSQMGTGVEKYGVESAAMQTGQPSGGPGNEKTMQRPQKSSGRTPLSDELKISRLFSVAGIILFYGLGSCVWINGLIGKRRERG